MCSPSTNTASKQKAYAGRRRALVGLDGKLERGGEVGTHPLALGTICLGPGGEELELVES